MKKLSMLLLSLSLALTGIVGCSNGDVASGKEYDYDNKITTDKKVLVAFFSRADENYGVGYVEKGNTQVIAEFIDEKINADMFQIARKTPYPATYKDCTAEAQKEKNADARPELAATIDSIEQYDVIFLGYPIWYGTMPMPVYTFLESFDFSGKTVIPFCTHEGSGYGSTLSDIPSEVTGATFVSNGFSCRGTTVGTQKSAVESWIDGLNLNLN